MSNIPSFPISHTIAVVAGVRPNFMKIVSAYETPGEDDWARGGILSERFTRFRGHAQIPDHFRDILVILTAVNRGAVLVSSNAHMANWGNMLKRQGETLRLKIL